MTHAYEDAADEVSLRERDGQIATATRGLERLEQHVRPDRLLDVGCWTGSFLVAARARGWEGVGIEPSQWAVDQARGQGLAVEQTTLARFTAPIASFRAVVACDVLEHLDDPFTAVARFVELLEPGGALYLTVPDSGSALARALGARWWSVLPMHFQYFTRTSMLLLLQHHGLVPAHLGTHPKVFTARYYAERLEGYSPRLARVVTGALERLAQAERRVSPDFRDRMEIIAVRR